jgi:hypothetical protein
MCWREQKQEYNIIESTLGIPLWLEMIHTGLHRALASNDYGLLSIDNNITFHVRGDASFVLMELVQQRLINTFQQA